MPLSIIILAAGQGRRMKSSRPKVVHVLAGRPLLQHVVDSTRLLAPEQVMIVIGHQAEQVRQVMQGQELCFIEQPEQLGTGHAVAQCLGELEAGNDILVLVGDVPLIRAETLTQFVKHSATSAVGILSFEPVNAFGYGRIVRSEDGNVEAIVEHKDCSEAQLSIIESSSGIIYIRGDKVGELVSGLNNDNAQGEYYLTDVVSRAATSGGQVCAMICADADEVTGVNNQQQLARVETLYRARQAESLMDQGAKLYDPLRIEIRGELNVGSDVEIDINCVFEGLVTLGDRVRIGANCVIRNSTIAADSEIKPMTSIDEAIIGSHVSIGPFARVRPGTECADNAKIGNFVEIKKAYIGAGSKVNHLSYIGDTEMGKDVNIGAGTITCNYDGANKFKTIIEDGVFIGSNTQLVAPVRISRNATIGAGSTITRDTPADKLTLSRSKQLTMHNWTRPKKI